MDIRFHHLGAEIVCRITSPRPVQRMIYRNPPNSAKVVMAFLDFVRNTQSSSKRKRWTRISFSKIFERKSSVGSWDLARRKLTYRPTEFRQGSDDVYRWWPYGPGRILKQANKMSKNIFSHDLWAEIICWIMSPRTVQNYNINLPNFAKAMMTSIDDCCISGSSGSQSWSKPKRRVKTSVSTILERKSSAAFQSSQSKMM